MNELHSTMQSDAMKHAEMSNPKSRMRTKVANGNDTSYVRTKPVLVKIQVDSSVSDCFVCMTVVLFKQHVFSSNSIT